mmetsp:Transcript_5737/g.7760  ORF Transcript_5737/g.7760 Transcript_5737/m.7760 type:complete len:93 (+) Transcript_5737:610-888(+)
MVVLSIDCGANPPKAGVEPKEGAGVEAVVEPNTTGAEELATELAAAPNPKGDEGAEEPKPNEGEVVAADTGAEAPNEKPPFEAAEALPKLIA